jgi:hypothetical protein
LQRLYNSIEATFKRVSVCMNVATTNLSCYREADVNTGHRIVISVYYQIYYIMLNAVYVVLSNICESYDFSFHERVH